jgi:putative tricarboxylic transport membrane protein
MPNEKTRSVDWEHFLFLAIMAAFLVWYLADATLASPTFSNLILVAPVGAVAVGLLIYVVVAELIGPGAAVEAAAPAEGGATGDPSRFRTTTSLGSITLLMVFFALFVAAIPYAGFDVATFVFVAATLWLLGERRVAFTLSLALGIAVGISIAAMTLLTFPLPMGVARILWRAF